MCQEKTAPFFIYLLRFLAFSDFSAYRRHHSVSTSYFGEGIVLGNNSNIDQIDIPHKKPRKSKKNPTPELSAAQKWGVQKCPLAGIFYARDLGLIDISPLNTLAN